jgi:hypothetical protein
MTVVTQFLKGSNGELSEIKRFYVQGGKVIPNSESTIEGNPGNSITVDFCRAQKIAFNDRDYFEEKGGMSQFSKGVAAPMVLVMSLWDDHYSNMLWLDSTFPTDADPSEPGKGRGSCDIDSGVPSEVEDAEGGSQVIYCECPLKCDVLWRAMTDVHNSQHQVRPHRLDLQAAVGCAWVRLSPGPVCGGWKIMRIRGAIGAYSMEQAEHGICETTYASIDRRYDSCRNAPEYSKMGQPDPKLGRNVLCCGLSVKEKRNIYELTKGIDQPLNPSPPNLMPQATQDHT